MRCCCTLSSEDVERFLHSPGRRISEAMRTMGLPEGSAFHLDGQRARILHLANSFPCRPSGAKEPVTNQDINDYIEQIADRD